MKNDDLILSDPDLVYGDMDTVELKCRYFDTCGTLVRRAKVHKDRIVTCIECKRKRILARNHRHTKPVL